jgi:hypothetical protein
VIAAAGPSNVDRCGRERDEKKEKKKKRKEKKSVKFRAQNSCVRISKRR